MIETHYIYIHYCNWGYPESCTPEPGPSHRGCYGLCEAACHGAGGVLAFFHLSNWLKPSEFIILKLLGNESWKMFFQDVHHWLLILEWQINIFNRLHIYYIYWMADVQWKILIQKISVFHKGFLHGSQAEATGKGSYNATATAHAEHTEPWCSNVVELVISCVICNVHAIIYIYLSETWALVFIYIYPYIRIYTDIVKLFSIVIIN